jgi:hypothetical protein
MEGHWDEGFRRMALFSSSIARRRGLSVLDIIFEYLNEYSSNVCYHQLDLKSWMVEVITESWRGNLQPALR